MAYCFMSTEKIKSLGAFTRKYEHNYRTANVPNADKSRIHLNEEVVPMKGGKNYADCFRHKMADIGHTPRSNAVLGIEIVMTYNSQNVSEDFDIDKWKKANVEWLKANFPEDCILSVVMHRDEGPDNGRSAHLHAIVLPIHEKKLNCKHYLSGRKKLVELQDSYGEAMKPLGLDRGLKGSSAKHEDIRRFYDTLNKAVSSTLPAPKEGETLEDYYERINEHYSQTRVEDLKTVKKLEREIDELKTKAKMARFEATADAREDSKTAKKLKEEAEAEKKRLEKEKIELDKKRAELEGVEARLRNFNALMNGLKNHPDKMYTEDLSRDIQSLIEWEQEFEAKHGEIAPEDMEDLSEELYGGDIDVD